MSLILAHERTLSVDDYVSVLQETIMRDRRPLANRERIRQMLAGANLIVTARDEAGILVGLARCITDWAWICYCAELAVRETHQRLGVGKAILDKAVDLLGPRIGLTLNADKEAAAFYERIGMQPAQAFWTRRQDYS